MCCRSSPKKGMTYEIIHSGEKMGRIIDLSQTVEDRMPVYPGDEDTRLVRSKQFEADGFNNHTLTISMHGGTHIDGMMHMTVSGEYISVAAPEEFINAGCILDVRNQAVIRAESGYAEMISANSAVLLYTGHAAYYGRPEYFSDHPILHMDFCKLLIRQNVRMVGMDMPSPDRFPFEIHKTLLKNGILIIENLTNLNKLLAPDIKDFEVIALPLKIRADSSIARVVARILTSY